MKNLPRTWKQDGPFVKWLLDREYAYCERETVKPFVSDGVILYMWEAWCAGGGRV